MKKENKDIKKPGPDAKNIAIRKMIIEDIACAGPISRSFEMAYGLKRVSIE